jgi:hypothetical protein
MPSYTTFVDRATVFDRVGRLEAGLFNMTCKCHADHFFEFDTSNFSFVCLSHSRIHRIEISQ